MRHPTLWCEVRALPVPVELPVGLAAEDTVLIAACGSFVVGKLTTCH